MKDLITDDEQETIKLCKKSKDTTRGRMWKYLFGTVAMDKMTVCDVNLPHLPAKDLDKKKFVSLVKNYYLIPDEDRQYYPDVSEVAEEEEEENNVLEGEKGTAKD